MAKVVVHEGRQAFVLKTSMPIKICVVLVTHYPECFGSDTVTPDY